MINRYFNFPLILILILILPSCSGDTTPNGPEVPADLKVLNENITKDSLNAEYFYDRSQYFFKVEDVSLAIRDVQRALILDSTKAKYYLAMGDYHFAINKTSITIESLRRAAKLEPENKEILLKLGELFYIVMKYDSAMFYVNRSLSVEQTNPKAHFQKGMILKESGDTANAVLSFQTAVDQDQKYFDAFIQLGMLHERASHNISLGYFDNAISLRPKSTEARYFRALYFQDRGDLDGAMKEYDEILKIDSNHVYSWYNMGYIFFVKEKNYKRAKKVFDRAYQLDPSYTSAIYMRGLCNEKLGDIPAAAKDFNAVLVLAPSHEKAMEGLKRIGKK